MCNTSFYGILTGKSIYSIILGIQGHLQGLKVNSEVKCEKTLILRKQIERNLIGLFRMMLTSLSCHCD